MTSRGKFLASVGTAAGRGADVLRSAGGYVRNLVLGGHPQPTTDHQDSSKSVAVSLDQLEDNSTVSLLAAASDHSAALRPVDDQKLMMLKVKETIANDDLAKCLRLIDERDYSKSDLFIFIEEAVDKGRCVILQELVNRVPDEVLNAKNQFGKTVLYNAINVKDLECCRILMSRPSTLQERDNDGNTPLHHIAKDNFIEACKEFIKIADLNMIRTTNKKGETAVHLAASEYNDESILKLLLENGGKPDTKTHSQHTPLHYAAQKGLNNCVEVLLQYVDDNKRESYLNGKTKEGSTALILAAKRGFTECCRLLVGSNVDIRDRYKSTALHYAAEKGSRSVVEFLIQNRADSFLKNQQGKTALFLSAARDNDDCLAYLLENTPLADKQEELLQIATKKKCLRCVEELLLREDFRKAIDTQNDDGNTCLHLAISDHSYEIAHAILNCSTSASKEIANKKKEYPLHLAAKLAKGDNRPSQKRRMLLCNVLLRRSYMIVNKSNIDNETPLHLASRSGNLMTVRALLLRGCRVLAKNNMGYTAIHLAAMAGHDEVLHVLITRLKTNNERRDLQQNKTHPLHLASMHGHWNCCEIIVKELKMKDLMVKDDAGHFPVDLAYEERKYDVFSYLLSVMTPTEDDKLFLCRLHTYCGKSIEDDEVLIFEAIIKSSWCCLAFDGMFCNSIRNKDVPRPCKAFKKLVTDHPLLACRVMDKMITADPKKQDVEVHNFTLFEFIYFDKKEARPDEVERPFTDEGLLKSSSEEYTDVSWARDHPLMGASAALHTEVLEHKLTRSWLRTKMAAYTSWMLYAYIFLDVLTALLTTRLVDEFHNCASLKNGTICLFITGEAHHNSSFDACHFWNSSNACSGDGGSHSRNIDAIVLQLLVIILFAVLVLFEGKFLTRGYHSLKRHTNQLIILTHHHTKGKWRNRQLFSYLWMDVKKIHSACSEYFSPMRCARLFCMLMMMVPVTATDFTQGMRGKLQYQFGVTCSLVSWLHLVSSINRVPAFSIFMPFTIKFVASFLKIVLHITIIIYAFATAFRFLLEDEIFDDPSTAFIKTLEWMLGELDYGETFMTDKNKTYFVLASILFVVYVTTIAGFIVNMIVMHSEDQMQSYKSLARFHHVNGILRMQLLVDDCFPKLRRKYARSQKTVELEPQYTRLGKESKSSESVHGKGDREDQDTNEQNDLNDKLDMLALDIDELKHDIHKLTKSKRYLHEISEESSTLEFQNKNSRRVSLLNRKGSFYKE